LSVFAVATKPGRRIGEWLIAHDDPDMTENELLYRKIIIPANKKREYRQKLQLLGLNTYTIYPGMDGLGHYLRRYYTPEAAEPKAASALN